MTKILVKAAEKLMKEKDVWYEEATDFRDTPRGRIVLASNIRKPTIEEVSAEIDNHAFNTCNGTIIVDEHGYLYDLRSCAICGKGLGTI